MRALPANLAQSHGLSDVRGYDGVDPARYVELLDLAADPSTPRPSYATTQWLLPHRGFLSADGVRLHPVLDLLGVRWLIFRGRPPAEAEPVVEALDYWVLENPRALPRVFIPARVEVVADDRERLRRLADPVFDPRRLALVESPVSLPPGDAAGSARIVDELPTRLEIELETSTPALVVVADRHDPGWRAELDGRGVPVLRVDHALRGVVVPAGAARLVMTYRPASLHRGAVLMLVALVLTAGWYALGRRTIR